MVVKGYLTKLLTNEALKCYIHPHEPAILIHLELVVNTVNSMEEALQQQQEAEALTLLLMRKNFMTVWTERRSTAYNVQVLTEDYSVTPPRSRLLNVVRHGGSVH